jgi:hypothetical protein
LDLLVEEGDELLEQVEVFGAGEGVDLLDQSAAPLDAPDEGAVLGLGS